jgi:endoglucanase
MTTTITLPVGEYQINGGAWAPAPVTIGLRGNGTEIFTIITGAASPPPATLSPPYCGVNFPQGCWESQTYFTSDPHYTDYVDGNGHALGYLYHDAYLNTAAAGIAGVHPDLSLYAGLPNYNIIRIGERWERIQPTLGAALDSTRLTALTREVNAVTSRGAVALIDIHNFGAYPSASSNLIGGAGPTAAQYNDLMARLATAFKANPRVWLDPMNEPIDFPGHAPEWATYIQGALNAIRAAGFTNKVLIPGINYTGANTWFTSGSAAALVGITDSANNYAYQVHQYADSDTSGTHRGTIQYENYFSDILAPVTAWAEANNKHLFLGEWNTDREGANRAQGERMLALALKHMQAHPCWIGFTLWQGGPMEVDDLYTTWSEADGTKPSRHDRVIRAGMVTGSAVAAPINTAAGTLSGTATEGNTLSVSGVAWSHTGNSDLGFEEFYQWQRNPGSGWADIVGADQPTLPLSLPLVGKTVRRGTYAKNIGELVGTARAYTPASSTIAASAAGEVFEQTTSVPDTTWTAHPLNAVGSSLAAGSLTGTPSGGAGIFALKSYGYLIPGYVYELAVRASASAANMIVQVGIDEQAISAGSYLATQVNLSTGAFTDLNGTGADSPTRQAATVVTTVSSEKLIKQRFSVARAIKPTVSIGLAVSSPGGTISPTLVSIKCVSEINGLGPELLSHTVPGGTGWTAALYNVSGATISGGTFSGTPNGSSGVLATDAEASVNTTDTYELSSQAQATGGSNVIYRIGVDDPSAGGYVHIYVNLSTGAFTYNNSGGSSQPTIMGTSTVTTVGSEKLIKVWMKFASSGTPTFVAGIAETSPAGTVVASAISFRKVL